MAINAWRRTGIAVAAVAFAFAATACSDDEEASTTTAAGGGEGGGKIAFLLPESKTARYETQDRPNFEAKVAEICPECEILYSNADQDAAKQQTQAEAALTDGAQVLVLGPVDGTAAAAIVAKANEANVPVISYDRLILDAEIDLYISFDNEAVGVLQAESLEARLDDLGVTSGDIVQINGSPTDNNAKLFKQGATSVLEAGPFTVAAESDTVDWSTDNAQKDMEGHITTVGKDNIVGVLAANDGTAGGAIAALKAAGVTKLPPVTGQDAEVAAIQRILAGEQYMTVYKAIKLEAEAAAIAAVALVRGEEVQGADKTVNNNLIDVPSILLTPIAVNKDNIKSTVIADGFWSVEDICTAEFKTACTDAGIS